MRYAEIISLALHSVATGEAYAFPSVVVVVVVVKLREKRKKKKTISLTSRLPLINNKNNISEIYFPLIKILSIVFDQFRSHFAGSFRPPDGSLARDGRLIG